jgi:hypothetical protein
MQWHCKTALDQLNCNRIDYRNDLTSSVLASHYKTGLQDPNIHLSGNRDFVR